MASTNPKNKVVLFSCLTLALNACNNGATVPTCNIEVQTQQAFENQKVRIFRYSDEGKLVPFDSTEVKQGKALLQVRPQSQTEFMVLTVGNYAVSFIAENADLKLNTITGDVAGGALNEQKQSFERNENLIRKANTHKYDSLATLDISPDDKRYKLSDFVTNQGRQSVDRAMEIVLANKDNALGQYVFWKGVAANNYVNSEIFFQELKRAGENVVDFPPIKPIKEKFANIESTQVGNKIKDVNLLTSDGTKTTLSSALDTATITVVHLFDPRNENTPNSLKLLHEINNINVKNRGAKVVSIACGAPTEIVERIEEKFRVGWSMYTDPEYEMCGEYGIESLPYYIFVGKDGKIKERGISETAIYHWIKVELSE